jgi:hypothetical protein
MMNHPQITEAFRKLDNKALAITSGCPGPVRAAHSKLRHVLASMADLN